MRTQDPFIHSWRVRISVGPFRALTAVRTCGLHGPVPLGGRLRLLRRSSCLLRGDSRLYPYRLRGKGRT